MTTKKELLSLRHRVSMYAQIINENAEKLAQTERALGLALQHAFDQGYIACYEINCPKSKDEYNRCYNPKDYVCKRYAKAHFIKMAKEKR